MYLVVIVVSDIIIVALFVVGGDRLVVLGIFAVIFVRIAFQIVCFSLKVVLI